MNHFHRQVTVLLVAALLFGICFACFSVGSQAEEAPTLYVNDEVWYNTGLYPTRFFNSTCVPISIFEQIRGVTVTFYENNTALVYRDADHFISLDFNNDTAMTPSNERFGYRTTLVGNERYLPMVTICYHLGLQQESFRSPVNDSISARICDGNQKIATLRELLERYNPGALYPSVTTPPDQETTAPNPVENGIFLIVDGIGTEGRIPAMLELCAEYGANATFFISPEMLAAEPALVLAMIAGGHSLGFLVDAEGALDALHAANAALVERFHMTTRLVRVRGERTEALERALAAAGYSCWDYQLDMGQSEAEVRTALTTFRSSLDGKGYIVLRALPDGFNTVGYLREFFNSAKGKSLFFPITPAYQPPAA